MSQVNDAELIEKGDVDMMSISKNLNDKVAAADE
jgi:hypothetical protein